MVCDDPAPRSFALGSGALSTQAASRSETNNLPLAEQHLERAHALVPDNAETNFALGNLRVAQRDSLAAKTHYEAALRIDPKHKGVLNNLGVLALNDDQPAAAVGLFPAGARFGTAQRQDSLPARESARPHREPGGSAR